jgi:periplasmic protein TonB
MKSRIVLSLIAFGLTACTADAPPAATPALAAETASVASSCPARAGTDMHTALPAPHFLPAPAAGAAVRLPARLRSNTPAYPSGSIPCHEEGKVTITYCVTIEGAVENVQVVVSSGFARLDNAMLAWAATDRHRPGTVDGQPRRYCGLTIEQEFEIGMEPPEHASELTRQAG